MKDTETIRLFDNGEVVIDYIYDYDDNKPMLRVTQFKEKEHYFKYEYYCEIPIKQACLVYDKEASKNSIVPIYRCSNCQKKALSNDNCTVYCPRCGSIMLLDNDDRTDETDARYTGFAFADGTKIFEGDILCHYGDGFMGYFEDMFPPDEELIGDTEKKEYLWVLILLLSVPNGLYAPSVASW